MTRLTAVKSTVTVPSMPTDIPYTVYGRDGQYPYGTRTLYGRTRIRVRWPALMSLAV
jgi:hypothetical protein